MNIADLIEVVGIDVEVLWVGLKVMVVLALVGYSFFSYLVVRQVEMMVAALNGLLDLPVKLMAYAQLGLSLLVTMVAVLIL